MDSEDKAGNKTHRARQSGSKAEKRADAVAKKKARLAEGTAAEKKLAGGKHKDHRVRTDGRLLRMAASQWHLHSCHCFH